MTDNSEKALRPSGGTSDVRRNGVQAMIEPPAVMPTEGVRAYGVTLSSERGAMVERRGRIVLRRRMEEVATMRIVSQVTRTAPKEV